LQCEGTGGCKGWYWEKEYIQQRVLVVGGYKLVAKEGCVPDLGLGGERRGAQYPESPIST